MNPHTPSAADGSFDRRTWIKSVAAAGVAFAGLGRSAMAHPQDSRAAAPGKLRILVLGGTDFLGPKIVESALARGHKVTLFNRGRTNPSLFPEVEKLKGDRRKGDYESLKGDRSWDVIVDTSAYFPRQVKEIADLLAKRATHYVFISTISVYPDADGADTDETTPVGKIADEAVEKITGETYGPLKALCEQAAEKAWPGKTTNIRPGLIVGDGDNTDRFSYWPVRVAEGGEVLAPIGPDETLQWVDVKDLGLWTVKTAEEKIFGVFNAVGPTVKLGDLLQACKKASGSDATFTYVSREFLEKEKVAPWADLPVWIPRGEGKERNAVCSGAKAAFLGLGFRSPEESAKDALAYEKTRPKEKRRGGGLSREREKALLQKWKEQAVKTPK